MQHVPLMGKVYRLSNGLEIRGRLSGWQWTFGDELPERQAFHVIHRKEVLALGETDFVNGDDVRVLQTRGGGRFGAEALDEIFAGQRSAQKHFHRDDPV